MYSRRVDDNIGCVEGAVYYNTIVTMIIILLFLLLLNQARIRGGLGVNSPVQNCFPYTCLY